MNWMKKEVRPAASANSDPRIDSPEIKVVYPSRETATKDAVTSTKDAVSTSPTDAQTAPAEAAPVAQTLPQTQATEIKTTDPRAQTATDPLTPAKPASAKWIDTLKQNATLFIIIALISFGIGVIAGKKLKS